MPDLKLISKIKFLFYLVAHFRLRLMKIAKRLKELDEMGNLIFLIDTL